MSLRTARVAPEKRFHRPPAVAFYAVVTGDDMAKMTYGEQLRHPNWQRTRLERLEAAGWRCEQCQAAEETLHVHHKRYVKGRMAWEYEQEDLAVLCENCHAEWHGYAELLDRVICAATFSKTPSPLVAAGLLAGFAAPHGLISDEVAEEVRTRCGLWFDLAVMAAGLGGNRIVSALHGLDPRGQNKWCDEVMSRYPAHVEQ